jgi:hypothetical protein
MKLLAVISIHVDKTAHFLSRPSRDYQATKLSEKFHRVIFCCAIYKMNFTLVNGQIYTPGLAIVNAPQPYTPLGGGESRNLALLAYSHQVRLLTSNA